MMCSRIGQRFARVPFGCCGASALVLLLHVGASVVFPLFPSQAIGEDAKKQETTRDDAKNANAAPQGLVRLSRESDVWIDLKRKLVVVDGEVTLREGVLEMFACPKGTKEHESVVAVNSTAQLVHTALLAVGAVAGHPAQFDPTYAPASGTEIEIWVLWTDAAGSRKKVLAQEWVKEQRTGKAMSHPWVFAGSSFRKDETDGKTYYLGDVGDLICVSNFPSATLDLPIKSSQTNEELLFTAFTDRIPPRGSKVRLVLIPKPVEKKPDATKQADGKKGE